MSPFIRCLIYVTVLVKSALIITKCLFYFNLMFYTENYQKHTETKLVNTLTNMSNCAHILEIYKYSLIMYLTDLQIT